LPDRRPIVLGNELTIGRFLIGGESTKAPPLGSIEQCPAIQWGFYFGVFFMSYPRDNGSTWGGILMVIAVIAAWGLGYHMRSQGFQINVSSPKPQEVKAK
jgi:hypothetical protein